MHKWTTQSECIFCLYRSFARPSQRATATRAFHTTGFLTQDRPNQRAKGRNASRPKADELPRKSPATRTKLSATSKYKPAINKGRQSNVKEASETLVYSRILKALSHETRMRKSPIEDWPDHLHYLRNADPDGVIWKTFRNMIRDMIDSAERGETKFTSRGVLSRLKTAAAAASWYEGLYREIRFAFLDHALSDGQSSETGMSPDADLRYPTEWYGPARSLQRNIHLHVGPTNSGKTYTALKRLEEAGNGFYAGPLRLLAHEVYSRFNSRGITCNLVTGDDVRMSETGADLYASTVEMVNTGRLVDVGVIDEIQMMGSQDRGWAWTRALLGAQAKELHLCGETRVVPIIREIVASMGDTLHIHQYERLNPLKVMSRSLRGNLSNLRKGDCVVSFSVVGIHALKKQIELDTGRRVAIVYGSLPPDTRARQASLFNDPDNDYDFLVASDAIGMGLNLSIKRVVFETTMKYNGSFRERLSISQLKQIAGRAGRYRTAQDDKKTAQTSSAERIKSPATVGLVTCLDEADLPFIQQALASEAVPLKTAGLLPPGEVFEDFAKRLPEGVPFEYILKRVADSVSLNPRFNLCDMKDQSSIARLLDSVPEMSVQDRLIFCAAPAVIRGRTGRQDNVVVELARALANNQAVTVADLSDMPLEVLDEPPTSERSYLEGLEGLHKALILYLWLSYRFPSVFRDQDMAIRAKELTEEKINTTLLHFSANPLLKVRLERMKKTSTLLREQIKGQVSDTGLVVNPDASVEEMEKKMHEDEQKQGGDGQGADVVKGLEDNMALNLDWGRGSGDQNLEPADAEPVVEEAPKGTSSASV